MGIRKSIVLLAAASSLFFTACSLITGVTPASQANNEGNVAYLAHRYDEALVKYQRSLDAAVRDRDRQYAAIAMYGLARTYAQLCQENNAEKWFLESIAIREKLPDSRAAYFTQNLLEYGSFLASWGRNEEAVRQYDRGMHLLESSDEKKTDPLGYAKELENYAALLASVGRTNDAAVAAEKAKSLRVTYKDRAPRFKSKPYPNCAQEQRK